MDHDQIQKRRKKFIMGLPVWDQVSELRADLDRLIFDVEKCLQITDENKNSLDSLPKINPNCERVRHSVKKTRDLDIVKLCSLDDKGQCHLLSEIEVKNDCQRLYKDATVGESIELLSKRLEFDQPMFVMVKPGKPWKRCRVRSVMHTRAHGKPATTIKLIADTEKGSQIIKVKKYAVAHAVNHGDKLRSCKRVVAGYSEHEMMPGIIGQDPYDFNHHRYLVFLDDGNVRYYNQDQVYPIVYQSSVPWRDYRFLEERVNKTIDYELGNLFKFWPRRHLLEAKPGLKFSIERNGLRVPATIISTDDDVMQIAYQDGTEEYLYKGSVRISAKDSMICKVLANDTPIDKLHYKLVGNMMRYHEAGVKAIGEEYLRFLEIRDEPIPICGRTARKSTGRKSSPPRLRIKLNDEILPDDRESFPDIQDLTTGVETHKPCTPNCLLKVGDDDTEACFDDLEESFKHYSDIKVPLKLGWKRIFASSRDKYSRLKKVYVYKAPCGRVLNSFIQIKSYLKQTRSKLDLDYFTFERDIILNRPATEFMPIYYEENIAANDSGERLERKLISLMNPFGEERLPRDFEYRNETFPHPMLRAKNFSFNTDFKSGCDCEDDCNARSSCKCHQLNEQAAGTNAHNKGSVDWKCQYLNKRLMQQVSTGIFECNEFCPCSSKCPNRVVQNGIRVRLQVRKTVGKGWGVFALDDIPRGAFICTYAAELLDDADQYGADDMYFADLDYIPVVEESKLDLDNADDKSDEGIISEEEHDSDASDPSSRQSGKRDRSPSNSPNHEYPEFFPRYPKRNRGNINRNQNAGNNKGRPIRQKPIYKPIFELLGEESHDTYTLDARMQGNVGRFFNHSCDPNAFVQNVFISTHDLRFPVVAFFTKRPVKAEDEITWNYNYKIDSIKGRQILCNCDAPNCKGRIL